MIEGGRGVLVSFEDNVVRGISEGTYTQAIPNDDMRADSRADPLFLIRITQEDRKVCRLLRERQM